MYLLLSSKTVKKKSDRAFLKMKKEGIAPSSPPILSEIKIEIFLV